MTDRELLEQILSNQQDTNKRLDNLENEMSDMKTEISDMKTEISDMKTEISDIKNETSDMKTEISDMKTEISDIKNETSDMKKEMSDMKKTNNKIEDEIRKINLHLENETDSGLQLIAENFITLTDKLNQAIPIADKNIAYEIKLNHAISEINKLREEFEAFKSQTA